MNTLEITHFNTETKETRRLQPADLPAAWDKPIGFLWIDIENAETSVLTEILTTLDIDCLWTDHFDNPEILPHLHDTTRAVSFYMYDLENAESLGNTGKDIQALRHRPFMMILGRHIVITYHQEPIDLIHYIKRDLIANFTLAGKTAGFIPFLLFQHSLYNFARLNLMNDNFLDYLELELIAGDAPESIQKISIAGYNILTLKKLNANLHIILLMLVSKKSYTISHEAREAFDQILNETVSIRDSIDSSRYLLDSIIAAIDAESSQKTSEIIRLLTITSCVFMPLSLITGIFGMNFFNIPGLQWKYGFLASLLAMFAVVFTFLTILRHLGWIGFKSKKNLKALSAKG